MSVTSALSESEIGNFWVATGLPTTIILFNQLSGTIGEFPLNKQFPVGGFNVIEDLLTGAEIEFHLTESVTNSRCVPTSITQSAVVLCSPWNGLARC